MIKKKKYLFIYLKTGGGHLAPARAMFNYLNQHFSDKAEPQLIYGFEKTPRWVKFIIEDGYRILQYTGKWFFEFLYALNKFHLIEVNQFESFQYCYLNDILAPLVLTPLFINIHILAGIRQNNLPPCLLEIAAYSCLLSIWFECVTPIFNSRSVADCYDILAYLAGSTVYFTMVGRNLYNLEWLPLSES